MKLIERIEQLWERDRKYTTRYMLVFSGSCFIHVVLAIMFALAGRPVFAVMNLVSLVVYCLWLWGFSVTRVNDLMLLVLYLDVLIHACVYNCTLGLETGFFLYTFLMIPVTFFMAIRDLKHQHGHTLVNSIVLSIVSVFLMLGTLLITPTAPLSEMQTGQFFQINCIMCALLLCVYTSEFMTETLTTQDSLSFHAENDPLTGLRNRYGFTKEIEKFHGTQYCVIMGDIDDFKMVNDTYGHNVGDVMLAKIGKTLLSSVRKDDILCRWGGEEFLMVIRSSLDEACAVVERIRQKLTNVSVDVGESRIGITMTFGLADCLEADSFEEQVKIADSNLLHGKRGGKNRLVVSTNVGNIAGTVPAVDVELDTTGLNEQLFNALSATSDTTYIYVCNLNTNVSRWSRSAVSYFGLPGEYMFDAANIWLGFVHPEDREVYSEDVEAVLSGKKHFHDVEYRARNRDGEYVRLVCKGVITEGDAVHPPLFAGTITNLGLTDIAGSIKR